VSEDCARLFISNFSSYGEAVKIFVESGLKDPASTVLCFAIEGSGLRLAAFIIQPVEPVCVAEADSVVS
jgi:hypothetical protein